MNTQQQEISRVVEIPLGNDEVLEVNVDEIVSEEGGHEDVLDILVQEQVPLSVYIQFAVRSFHNYYPIITKC